MNEKQNRRAGSEPYEGESGQCKKNEICIVLKYLMLYASHISSINPPTISKLIFSSLYWDRTWKNPTLSVIERIDIALTFVVIYKS